MELHIFQKPYRHCHNTKKPRADIETHPLSKDHCFARRLRSKFNIETEPLVPGFFRANFEIRTSPVFDDTIMKRAVSLTGKGSFYVAWRMDRQWTKNLVDRPPGTSPRGGAAPPRRMASVKKTLWARGTLLHGFTGVVDVGLWWIVGRSWGDGLDCRFAVCMWELLGNDAEGNLKFKCK